MSGSTPTTIDRIVSPMVRRIHDWWMGNRRDGAPDRADFDPAAFKDVLPNILLADVEYPPFRLRYRLVGARIADATGFNIIGRYLDEMMPTEPEAPWQDLYFQAFRQATPLVGVSECTTTSGGLFRYEYGLFPIRRGGQEIAQFIAIEDYGDLASTLTDLVEWRERTPRDGAD